MMTIATRDLLAFDNDRSNRCRAHAFTLYSPDTGLAAPG
jgi:hypothetical protein